MSATDGHANGTANGHAPRFAAPAIPDRLPPQNLEAERGAIGSMLLDPAAVDDVMAVLAPGEFYRDSHEVICRAIYDVRTAGIPVDSITVEEELRRRGDLEKAGGLDYLFDCINSVPHAANARHYAQIVKEKAVARSLIGAYNEGLRECYSDSLAAEDLVEAAERRVFAVGDRGHAARVVAASEAAARKLAELDRARAAGFVAGIRTGWRDLDEILGGVEPGQLLIVASRPSMGKTSLALQWAANVAENHGLPSLFVSLEMDAAELAARLLSGRSGVDSHKFRDPRRLSDADMEALGLAQAAIRDLPPILIDDSPGLTAARIAASARRARSASGIGMVFVDYLQLVDPAGEGESRQEQVAAICRRLKSLSREVGCPVVALAQLNRAVEARDGHRPRMSDLKESGQLEQDAHAVILLHRPEYYDANDQPGVAEVIVAKNRNGPTGTARLVFTKGCTRFDDLAEFAPGDGGGAF